MIWETRPGRQIGRILPNNPSISDSPQHLPRIPALADPIPPATLCTLSTKRQNSQLIPTFICGKMEQ